MACSRLRSPFSCSPSLLPELRAPPKRELRTPVLRLRPNLLAYLLGFGVIGIMWQNHRTLFRLVEKTASPTVQACCVGWASHAAPTLPVRWLPAVSFAPYLVVASYHLVP